MSPHPTPSKGGDDSRVMSAWDVGNGTPPSPYLTMTQFAILGSQAIIECFPLEALVANP